VPGRFPGEGAAAQDPLAGPATIGLGLDELRARDLRPFAAVAGDVAAMQLSAALYAAFDAVTPATLLPDPVRLLRDRLGFAGVVVSADLGAAIPAAGGVGDAAVAALRAGCDLLLVPGGRAEQDAVVRALTDAVGRGAIGRGRLAAAAARVLALKRAAGLDVSAAAP
jgi:beta-N-acetylhexosaminidase